MTTLQRAEALVRTARDFPLLGQFSAGDLLELVRLELGHAEILDGFRPYAGQFSAAAPLSPILHIISGNTPHAGLQSLARGFLLGAENLVKLPSAGLPEVEQFASALPGNITLSRELPPEWLRRARAWIVFGADETIAHFRKLAPAGVVFEAHPHRVSIGVVFRDHDGSLPRVAADVSRFNQKGCLSPHDIYVAGDARAYAARLAEEMERYERTDHRAPITVAEAAEVADMRANYRFRAASDARVQLWESADATTWTVIYEEDPWFASSCLNRVVFVKPLPENLATAIGPALDWLAGVGIWPATPDEAARVAALKPSRICAAGRLQDPPLTWHQEGRQTLAPLTRWVDFEPEVG